MADSETTPGLSSSLGGNGEESPCDDDLDRMLLQARISGLGNTLPSLPWESGVMSCIFGDGLLSRPTFAQPRPPAPVADTRKDPLAEAKSSRVRAAPENLYERSFHARADVPVQEEEDHLWVLAINKWCCIFSLAQDDPGSVGMQAAQCLVAEGESARDELIRDVFGLRSPRTAIKRANALLRCMRWHQKEKRETWPWNRESLTEFVKSLGESASAVSNLFESINFAHHVMDVPFCDEILRDRRLQGRARRLQGEKPEVKQQEALEVELVARLEKLVAGQTLCDVDTYVLGGELFALYSRSRWSDLRRIHSIWIDFDSDDRCSGFVEARTREHKTSNTVRTKRRAMPLVAPFPGVTEANWVSSWWHAAQRLGVDWSAVPFGPLVRAPNSLGKLGVRRCSSSEAGSMLCNALGLDGVRRRTSHVLKGTTLTWTGKRGFGEREGLLLGHHATGSSSLACYSRELLSAPLRAYRSMLQEIRTNVFKPDTTRSGWLASRVSEAPAPGDVRAGGSFVIGEPLEAAMRSCVKAGKSAAGDPGPADDAAGVLMDLGEMEHYHWHNRASESSGAGQDPDLGSWDHVEQRSEEPCSLPTPTRDDVEPFPDTAAPPRPEVDDEPPSSSSSSTSSSSSSEASETEEQLVAKSGVSQNYEIDEPCWQHIKSRMLHRVQGDMSNYKTKCGRRTANVYKYLEGAYFKWSRCAVCWKGELLDSHGAMADKLKELMDRT